MSLPDPSLRALYARLEEVLGADHAQTLMTRLPSPPDELAKKADVDRQFEAVGVRFDNLQQRFDGLEKRFNGMEQRFERRFERIEDRLDRMDENMHHMFEMMQKHLKTNTTVMVTAMTALTAIYGGMLVAFVA
ncbi:MAG: hypothetical protein WD184_05255 [Acidimicrobiia bacterium]